MVKYFIVIIIGSCLLQFCNVIEKSSKERYLKNQPNQNIPIRLDGYYYGYSKNDPNVCRYFFYSNGKVLYAYCCRYVEMEKVERAFIYNSFPPRFMEENSTLWTNYLIQKDSISFEQINHWNYYPHYLHTGHILNDTSFVITKLIGVAHFDGEKEIKRNDTFYFKKCNCKPDSSYSSWLK